MNRSAGKNQTKIVCDNCGVKAAIIERTPRIFGKGERMILVENVPVIRCSNCGESYVTQETMRELDQIRVNRHSLTERKEVVVGRVS